MLRRSHAVALQLRGALVGDEALAVHIGHYQQVILRVYRDSVEHGVWVRHLAQRDIVSAKRFFLLGVYRRASVAAVRAQIKTRAARVGRQGSYGKTQPLGATADSHHFLDPRVL